jgi:hypothetical protein
MRPAPPHIPVTISAAVAQSESSGLSDNGLPTGLLLPDGVVRSFETR